MPHYKHASLALAFPIRCRLSPSEHCLAKPEVLTSAQASESQGGLWKEHAGLYHVAQLQWAQVGLLLGGVQGQCCRCWP